MDISELKNRIKSGALSGWYILAGEEDYLKKYYLSEIRRSIVTDETFAPFNLSVYEGLDVNLDDVREAIESPPMMSDYKLIEWKYLNIDSMKEKDRDALISLSQIKELYPTSVFVILATADGFDMGTDKKPSKLMKNLSESFEVIRLDKSTDAQLLGWLKKHFDTEGIRVDQKALNALLFRVGRSMEVLNNEVTKLSMLAKSGKRDFITTEDVEEICPASTECDAFALSNAITEKNLNKAFLALTDLKARRVDPSAVIAMLEKTYAELMSVSLLLDEGKSSLDVEKILKIHPFKVKLLIASTKKLGSRIIASSLDTVRRLDASSKSGGLSGYGAIEMFIISQIPSAAV